LRSSLLRLAIEKAPYLFQRAKRFPFNRLCLPKEAQIDPELQIVKNRNLGTNGNEQEQKRNELGKTGANGASNSETGTKCWLLKELQTKQLLAKDSQTEQQIP
jgi:hypothetical protein